MPGRITTNSQQPEACATKGAPPSKTRKSVLTPPKAPAAATVTTNRNVHALIGTPHTDRLLHSAPEIKTLETAQREGEGDEEGDIESDNGKDLDKLMLPKEIDSASQEQPVVVKEEDEDEGGLPDPEEILSKIRNKSFLLYEFLSADWIGHLKELHDIGLEQCTGTSCMIFKCLRNGQKGLGLFFYPQNMEEDQVRCPTEFFEEVVPQRHPDFAITEEARVLELTALRDLNLAVAWEVLTDDDRDQMRTRDEEFNVRQIEILEMGEGGDRAEKHTQLEKERDRAYAMDVVFAGLEEDGLWDAKSTEAFETICHRLGVNAVETYPSRFGPRGFKGKKRARTDDTDGDADDEAEAQGSGTSLGGRRVRARITKLVEPAPQPKERTGLRRSARTKANPGMKAKAGAATAEKARAGKPSASTSKRQSASRGKTKTSEPPKRLTTAKGRAKAIEPPPAQSDGEGEPAKPVAPKRKAAASKPVVRKALNCKARAGPVAGPSRLDAEVDGPAVPDGAVPVAKVAAINGRKRKAAATDDADTEPEAPKPAQAKAAVAKRKASGKTKANGAAMQPEHATAAVAPGHKRTRSGTEGATAEQLEVEARQPSKRRRMARKA